MVLLLLLGVVLLLLLLLAAMVAARMGTVVLLVLLLSTEAASARVGSVRHARLSQIDRNNKIRNFDKLLLRLRRSRPTLVDGDIAWRWGC